MKKTIAIAAALVYLLLPVASYAETISEPIFSAKAAKEELKVKKFSTTDIMGNDIKGVSVRFAPTRFCGVSGASIFCNNVLETSTLHIAVGLGVMQTRDSEGAAIPVPATIVINDNGTRKDIPVPNYKYDSGTSSLTGAWSEYEIDVPLIDVKNAGVKSINAISVIMTNPATKTEGNFETILAQKQAKAIGQINKVYSFYLKIVERG
jgi:hypothetical protein